MFCVLNHNLKKRKLAWYKERQIPFYKIGTKFPRLHTSIVIDHIFLKDFHCNYMHRL